MVLEACVEIIELFSSSIRRKLLFGAQSFSTPMSASRDAVGDRVVRRQQSRRILEGGHHTRLPSGGPAENQYTSVVLRELNGRNERRASEDHTRERRLHAVVVNKRNAVVTRRRTVLPHDFSRGVLHKRVLYIKRIFHRSSGLPVSPSGNGHDRGEFRFAVTLREE